MGRGRISGTINVIAIGTMTAEEFRNEYEFDDFMTAKTHKNMQNMLRNMPWNDFTRGCAKIVALGHRDRRARERAVALINEKE